MARAGKYVYSQPDRGVSMQAHCSPATPALLIDTIAGASKATLAATLMAVECQNGQAVAAAGECTVIAVPFRESSRSLILQHGERQKSGATRHSR